MVSSQESAATCIHINKLKYYVVPEQNGGFWFECPTPLTILYGNVPPLKFSVTSLGVVKDLFFKVSVWVNNILLFLVGKVNSHI